MADPNEKYDLIPLSEISDEARVFAIAWGKKLGYVWVGDSHKLASDVMNFAKKYCNGKWSDADMKEIYKQGYSDCNNGLDCLPTAHLQVLKEIINNK